jgi:SAM-dependent methyltransferase
VPRETPFWAGTTVRPAERRLLPSLRRLRPYAAAAARRLGLPPRSSWPYTVPGAASFYERRWKRLVSRTSAIAVEDHVRATGIRDIEEATVCLLCGEARVQPLFHPVDRRRGRWRYHVVRCAECGLLYRNPCIRPERLGDLYGGGSYGKFLTGRYAKGRQRRYELVMSAFGRIFSEGNGRRLLDFGCGAGLFLELAHERGFDAYGVDLSPDAVEIARKRPGGANAHFGEPRKVPEIARGGFDVITIWSVLAHLPRPVEELAMLRGLLASSGVLLILTVNANSLYLKAQGGAWNGFTPNHLVFFSPATLARLLRKVGFAALVTRPAYGDAIELGTVRLRRRYEQRLRRNVDRGNQGNMLRAVAFTSKEEAERL